VPAPNLVGQVSDASALIHGVLTSGAGVVVPLTQQQFDLVSVLVGSDASALIQGVLTSGAGVVVPLTVLQSDIYSFLVGIAGMDPAVAAVTLTYIQSHFGGVAGAGPSAADASKASLWRLVLPFALIPRGPLAGDRTGVAPLGETAASIWAAMTEVGRAASLPRMAPVSNDGAIPMDVPSFLGPAYTELLRSGLAVARAAGAAPGVGGLALIAAAGVLSLSLAALAAAALPGVGGLVILTAAGVRVGQRQAKATFALRPMGIAAFARPGAVPLGVVRSGSLVVIRPRALAVARPGAFSGGGRLDEVA